MLRAVLLILHLFYITSHRHHNTNGGKNITITPKNRTCNYENCPEGRGICSIDNICYCLPGFITVPDSKYGDYECNYLQKSQMIAFLLEFVLSFGTGHFYIKNYAMAIPKCIFCIAFLVVTCLLPFIASRNKQKQLTGFVPYIQCMSMVLFCCWQIFDSILFGLNKYRDGNGITLEAW
jgi:hypothetical protein